MAVVVHELAVSFLMCMSICKGTLTLNIEHKESVNAIAGQNISLPCIMSLEHETSIIQMQWNKNVEKQVQNLVVYSVIQSTHYNVKDWRLKFQLVNTTNTNKPYGSILHLNYVSEKDTGIYVCEVASFPHGFFKRETKVYVSALPVTMDSELSAVTTMTKDTEPQVSLMANSPDGILIEGDEVNVTCSSNPPADVYCLRSSQSDLSLESQSGDFTIHGITRHIKDVICLPIWNSTAPHLQSLKATVPLTVDFLDSIMCNSSSQRELEAGTNLTIQCDAKSSMSLHYIWKKENITVSHTGTLSLWSVNTEDSGKYSLTIQTVNNRRLERKRDFVVTVLMETLTEEWLDPLSVHIITQAKPRHAVHERKGFRRSHLRGHLNKLGLRGLCKGSPMC